MISFEPLIGAQRLERPETDTYADDMDYDMNERVNTYILHNIPSLK
jgi:hypothetical protein